MATAEFHAQCLDNLCRICGKRAQTNAQKKKGPAKYCAKYQVKILDFYGVDVSADSTDIHPTKICDQCYRRILNHENSTSTVSVKYGNEKEKACRVTSELWVQHAHNTCAVCSRYLLQSKPGTTIKEARGRPTGIIQAGAELDVETGQLTVHMHSTPARQVGGDKVEIEVQTSPSLLAVISPIVTPPKPPTPIPRSGPSVKQCMQRSLDSPLTKEEERLHTSLTKRKLNFSSDKTVMYCKTRGQPLVFKKLRRSRKTETVSQHVLKKRAQDIASCRRLVSGGSVESCVKQHGVELKSLSKATLQSVCEKAGVKNKFLVTTHQVLAMKTSLGLSWMQCRKQKIYLASLGIKTASEHKQRVDQKLLLGDHLEGGMVKLVTKQDKAPDSKGGIVERSAPYAQVKDLSKFLNSRLDEYNDTGRLTWHGGAIPPDEIWVKMGGDHGGRSFKMALQVLNVTSPNAKENTIATLCFEGKDSDENMERMVGTQREAVQQLMQATWRGKRVRLFLFGDYAFLAKMYGLSGAQGTFGCLWCLIPTSEIQVELGARGRSIGRKLSSMKQDHREFKTKAKGKKTKAALYHNCIRDPLWDVPVRYVCPPYLHILLGIVKRHHDLLESACHDLDASIAKDMAKADVPLDDSLFHQHVQLYKDINELREQRSEAVRQLEAVDETTPLAALIQEEGRLKTRVSQLDASIETSRAAAASNLGLTSGPVTAHLEVILKKHKIEIQAYHSRSFVGNHCSQYLKEPVFTDLCDSIPTKTAELTKNSHIQETAERISSKFKQLACLFSAVHRAVSHCNPIPESDIDDIQDLIDSYLAFYRQHFPMKILPKHHFLEDHATQWIRRWGFGMGFHGEQGGEALHA